MSTPVLIPALDGQRDLEAAALSWDPVTKELTVLGNLTVEDLTVSGALVGAPLFLTNTTPAGTGAATAETDLQTATIAANTLAVGDIVQVKAGGTFSGTAGLKTMRLYFGGTLLVATFSSAALGEWRLQGDLVVTGASAQKAIGMALAALTGGGSGDVRVDYTTPAAAISGSITVKTTGETANSADELTSEMLIVEVVRV